MKFNQNKFRAYNQQQFVSPKAKNSIYLKEENLSQSFNKCQSSPNKQIDMPPIGIPNIELAAINGDNAADSPS